jgi:hypothetical protein
MNSDCLKRRQQYVIKKVTTIMQPHAAIKYSIQFRDGKIKTAGTILEDVETQFKQFIFSNYWIQILSVRDLNDLIKHECAHALSHGGHGSDFKKICEKIKCSKKWQFAKTDVCIDSSLLKKHKIKHLTKD